jgi:hypothetical protein
MVIFASLSKNKMIEQINDHVFRVSRTDLRQTPGAIFEQIQDIVQCDASYLTARKRSDANINGSLKLIEDIENDYRSHALVIVHRNTRYPVIFRRRSFAVITDRYNRIISVLHSVTGRETITRKIGREVLKVYHHAHPD